ncbi:hypothetical protein SAMN04489806_1098 [Paramicrobacterium humi]|uniref:Uncharacterized protein n=2 Tax=Paramicrobacterium humi TaxID=640635 RepID=A0A1H4KAW4_9MICO|nr:hypothetical protein SAMN04489806_1098 [Microbacterium humi]
MTTSVERMNAPAVIGLSLCLAAYAISFVPVVGYWLSWPPLAVGVACTVLALSRRSRGGRGSWCAWGALAVVVLVLFVPGVVVLSW